MTLAVGTSLAQTPSIPKDLKALIFDSRWWHKESSEEQQGFLYGYQDCRQPVRVPTASIADEQNFVSDALRPRNPRTPDRVTAAIEMGWRTMAPRKVLKGGEVFAGPHGFLDGEWWGGFAIQSFPPDVADMDRGYLEGYLECAAAPVTGSAVRHYQAVLNRHYSSGRHAHDAIADVLSRLLKSPSSGLQR